MSSSWEKLYDLEMETARAARTAGNEGKARVCARRAAGIVIAEYYRRQGIRATSASAYELLKNLQTQPQISAQIKEIAGHFLARVTPDYALPVPVDLIAEARWLADELLHKP